MIGYKAIFAVRPDGKTQYAIAKLEILGQVVQSAYSAKRRTNIVKTLEIRTLDTHESVGIGYSISKYMLYDSEHGIFRWIFWEGRKMLHKEFSTMGRETYAVQVCTYAEKFDTNPYCECSAGIHYFLHVNEVVKFMRSPVFRDGVEYMRIHSLSGEVDF